MQSNEVEHRGHSTVPQVWRAEELRESPAPALHDGMHTDVAIVGAGLTGMSLAYLLGKRGFSVAVIEQQEIGGGKTARSTGKATLAHGYRLSSLANHVSESAARKYAAMNRAGLDFIRERMAGRMEEVRRDFWLCTRYGERRLGQEYKILRGVGVRCEYRTADEVPLPLGASAGILLPEMIALNPAEFLYRLREEGKIDCYPYTRAELLDAHTLRCGSHVVTADFVVLTMNYPTNVPGFSAPLKLSRKTSCAAAMTSAGGFPFPDVMAYVADEGIAYRYAPGGELIVSGEEHRGAPLPAAMDRLTDAVRSFAPAAEVREVWTNNDTYTHDELPYVGEVGGVYVACGYGAWGMTNAAGAAVTLAEILTGGMPWYADAMKPGRNFLHGGASEFGEHMGVSIGGAARVLIGQPPAGEPVAEASAIARGCGGVIQKNGKRVGAYRDPDGVLHCVSLRCPHLGCELEWNEVDATWDCPCHGSRFSASGACVSNPADTGIGLD